MQARKRKQVAVIGLGRFGTAVARLLYERGHEVLGLDGSAEVIADATTYTTHAVQVDATDEQSLVELGLPEFDVGIVAIRVPVESSIVATLLLKQLGLPYVIARSHSDIHTEILRRVGADRVVFPEHDMGLQVAHTFASPNVLDYIDITPEYGISKIRPPQHWIGKTLGALRLRERYDLHLLVLYHGSTVFFDPADAEIIDEDDRLVIAGRDDQLELLHML